MFACECTRCGRRELRGLRSLLPRGRSFWSICRGCGAEVLVAVLPAGRAA